MTSLDRKQFAVLAYPAESDDDEAIGVVIAADADTPLLATWIEICTCDLEWAHHIAFALMHLEEARSG